MSDGKWKRGLPYYPGQTERSVTITDNGHGQTITQGEPPVEHGWRDIASVPRDGTAVLVMSDDWPGTSTGHATECNGHNTYVAEWWQDDTGELGEWVCYMDSIDDPRCPITPTHWMPLPRAPHEVRIDPPR